jgi:hypothetical protein
MERDVLLRPLGTVLYALPPYCTTQASLQKIAAAMCSAVADVTARSGDAAGEPQASRGVVEQCFAGRGAAETLRLDSALVEPDIDAGNGRGVLPEIGFRPAFGHAVRPQEEDVRVDAVLHILDEKPPKAHALTKEAHVIDGRLVYRGDYLL